MKQRAPLLCPKGLAAGPPKTDIAFLRRKTYQLKHCVSLIQQHCIIC